jgi:hypothetical protein
MKTNTKHSATQRIYSFTHNNQAEHKLQVISSSSSIIKKSQKPRYYASTGSKNTLKKFHQYGTASCY